MFENVWTVKLVIWHWVSFNSIKEVERGARGGRVEGVVGAVGNIKLNGSSITECDGIGNAHFCH